MKKRALNLYVHEDTYKSIKDRAEARRCSMSAIVESDDESMRRARSGTLRDDETPYGTSSMIVALIDLLEKNPDAAKSLRHVINALVATAPAK